MEMNDDDETLDLDMDEIVKILEDFYKKRDDRIKNIDTLGNPRMKKRNNFETEEQKKAREENEKK